MLPKVYDDVGEEAAHRLAVTIVGSVRVQGVHWCGAGGALFWGWQSTFWVDRGSRNEVRGGVYDVDTEQGKEVVGCQQGRGVGVLERV